MKTLLFLILAMAAFFFGGCTNPPGMTFYQPMSGQAADGGVSYKSVKIASFAVDIVGLRRFSINYLTGEVTLDFQENVLIREQYAVQDKDGKIVGTLNRTTAPGIYTARVIDSYGKALQSIIKESAAGVTGAILSAAGPIALGNGLSAIPIK